MTKLWWDLSLANQQGNQFHEKSLANSSCFPYACIMLQYEQQILLLERFIRVFMIQDQPLV